MNYIKSFKQRILANHKSKYEPGDFGYWWNVKNGYPDIDGKVYMGDIECPNDITSLYGCPRVVYGMFKCNRCRNLKTLKGGPIFVTMNYICLLCDNLTSLEGAPIEVHGDFLCRNCNRLTSLKGISKYIKGDFNCINCKRLPKEELADFLNRDGIEIIGNIITDYGEF